MAAERKYDFEKSPPTWSGLAENGSNTSADLLHSPIASFGYYAPLDFSTPEPRADMTSSYSTESGYQSANFPPNVNTFNQSECFTNALPSDGKSSSASASSVAITTACTVVAPILPKEDTSSSQGQLPKVAAGKTKYAKYRSFKSEHSYVEMIARAILSAASHKLVLGDIYKFIVDNYPFYQRCDKGWKNSVRHNLSTSSCFVKAGPAEGGRGNFWAVSEEAFDSFSKGDFAKKSARRRAKTSNKKPTFSGFSYRNLHEPTYDAYCQSLRNPTYNLRPPLLTPASLCDRQCNLSFFNHNNPYIVPPSSVRFPRLYSQLTTPTAANTETLMTSSFNASQDSAAAFSQPYYHHPSFSYQNMTSSGYAASALPPYFQQNSYYADEKYQMKPPNLASLKLPQEAAPSTAASTMTSSAAGPPAGPFSTDQVSPVQGQHDKPEMVLTPDNFRPTSAFSDDVTDSRPLILDFLNDH